MFEKKQDNKEKFIIFPPTSQSMKAKRKERPKLKTAPKPKKGRRPASSTADILGAAAPKPKRVRIDPKWAPNYHALIGLRDQLRSQAGKLAKEATEGTPTYSMHMADAGTDSFDRDFALSMLSSDQDALYEVEEAIRRIQTGNYGKCELTGKPIPKSRLAAIPWTRFSADAQRQLEQEGALKRRQLSAFSSLPAAETQEPEEGDEGPAEPGTTEKE